MRTSYLDKVTEYVNMLINLLKNWQSSFPFIFVRFSRTSEQWILSSCLNIACDTGLHMELGN